MRALNKWVDYDLLLKTFLNHLNSYEVECVLGEFFEVKLSFLLLEFSRADLEVVESIADQKQQQIC